MANKFTRLGSNYALTDADKAEIVQMVIESLGGNPIFGYVDRNNNIILQGNLIDGAYNVKYEVIDEDDGSVIKSIDIGELTFDDNIYYSITNNLTNCTNGSTATQIIRGKSYVTVISAKNGYELESVIVTMGGNNVSVTNGIIDIASVTGNIVITATARATQTGANYYSVTNNLTNCTNDNSTTQAVEGGSYAAVISANGGYELKSVTVTMGGSPVSVTGGNINIANVTGNIVITAVAEEATVAINNLAQPDATATDEAAWNSGGWCNNSYMAGSSYAYRSATDSRLTTNTIAVEHGDTIYVKGINYADATYPQIALLDSSGNKIWHGYVGNAQANGYIKNLTGTVGEDYWHFDNAGSGNSDKGTRFVRFAGYPSGDISDIIITRNQPIE